MPISWHQGNRGPSQRQSRYDPRRTPTLARIADFGLACIPAIRQARELATDSIAGTLGYADPVYARTGVVTEAAPQSLAASAPCTRETGEGGDLFGVNSW